MSPEARAPRVLVVGAGRVGTALTHALRAAGVACDPVAPRALPPGTGPVAAGVVIVAVPDAAIAAVAARWADAGRLGSEQVVLHCAGAHAAAAVLGGLRGRVRGLGTLHPLRAFAAAAPAELRGVAFGIEGDPAARSAARELVTRLGGVPLELTADDLPLYHAAAVLASNYVVALCDAAADLLGRAVPEAPAPLGALLPLLASVVGSLQREGLPGALTGPLARGDAETVRAHLAALAARAPELLPLYRACGRHAAAVAARLGRGDPAGLAAARAALEAAPEAAPEATPGAAPEAAPDR